MRKNIFGFSVTIIFVIIFASCAFGFIRDGAVSGREGLSFSSVAYQFDYMYVTIRNRNHSNVNFGGTMIFLDRNYREVARADIPNLKIKRNSSRRFRGVFVKGSGHEAASASHVIWEF